jgi:hypothetical protein
MCTCFCSGPDMNPYCNVFDFMMGFMYYPYDTQDDTGASKAESVQLLIGLLQTRPFVETNAMAYNASWAAVTDLPYPEIYTAEWRQQAYDFCKINGRYCNIAMFNSYDIENHFVSTYYFNIEKGACNDTFTIDNWVHLRQHPPVSLVEKYFTCVATKSTAVFMSVGVAAGNTATMVPIVLLCTLPLLFVYLQVGSICFSISRHSACLPTCLLLTVATVVQLVLCVCAVSVV